jgi:hypothetical protein
MSAKKYYFSDGEKQQGAFSLEELKNQNITPTTKVWFEGLGEWTEAKEIEELKTLFQRKNPPPIPKENTNPVVSPPPLTKNAKPKKSSKIGILLVGLLIAIGTILFFISQNTVGNSYDSSPKTYQEKVQTVEQTEKLNPVRFLEADGTYRENFLGDKLKVKGTIKNSATVATYKDAVVRVTYYSKSKTNLGSEDYTIWDVFPPQKTKGFELKIKNYNNVKAIGWDVVSAKNYR